MLNRTNSTSIWKKNNIFPHDICCTHLFPHNPCSKTDLPGWVVQTYLLAQCLWFVQQVMTRPQTNPNDTNVNDPLWSHNSPTILHSFPMRPQGVGWLWETSSGTMQPMAWRGLGEGTLSSGWHTKTYCVMFNHEFSNFSHRFPPIIDELAPDRTVRAVYFLAHGK